MSSGISSEPDSLLTNLNFLSGSATVASGAARPITVA